ncbi:MEDS domain-containing protein [Micromonospora chaiyaphumensis]|uniref:MEDS: MEthanogen/methylotroph, DcmR Sensory domain n=1 Tax=Micromonospora chaiyaphumensis TaxID=307119 RepID=A0A1C4U202_9ACTN|nr:MEDS domain-containing protein [Micromonospora chaiyaphumensis]SCE65721.1 MEDS: MEthanogen/methylotroph, DcmR Sensory domain [Micromonospora chaiyaphumensis]
MTATTVVDQVRLGDHVCWTHDDESAALDALGRFAAAGLRLGHKVVCFTETSPPQAVRARVDAVGVPTEAAVATGQLRIVPALETYPTGARPAPEAMVAIVVDEVDRAQHEGYPGIRLAGDMAWVLRSGTSLDDLRRYETALNPLFLDARIAGLCLYDRRLFPADGLRALAAAHPGTAGPDAARTWAPLLRAYRTTDPPGLRLVGQVDQSNREAFTAVLNAVTADQRAAVLDVSELSFADVGAATALVRADRATGIRLVGCRPALHRLLDLLAGVPTTGHA